MIINSRGMVVYHKKELPELAAAALTNANSPNIFQTNSQGDLLAREIELVDPVAILTFGDEALARISGERSSEKHAGIWMQVTHYRGDPLLVLPNFDPEFVEQNPQREDFFNEIVDEFIKVWQYAVGHTFEETWRYAKP